ncbi:nitronate monooxygenase [Rhodococcus sovatensis]|uniref:Propionate 3-nitronate monooxygenase n=1 Tax=Rhodococcus sovatensis TaxID=1805840 RepID=A0ABZ2PHD7_9NOCA
MTDWTRTPFARTLGLRYPIVQGPFGGGISRIGLTAAVSDAGGLGSFGAHHLEPEELDVTVGLLHAATNHPFAVNLWVPRPGQPDELDRTTYDTYSDALRPWFERAGMSPPVYRHAASPDFDAQVEVVLARRPAVFSFVFGIPSPEVLAECRRRGIRTIGAATHLDEGIALRDAGVDAVVAAGYEAGGHRPAFLRPASDSVATGPLTAQLSAVLEIPVIAAGGIADGRGIAAALVLGADAVQIGTAFLATDQSGAPDAHKQALRSPRSRYTALTRAFSGRLARGIRNDFLDAFEFADVPAYPQQNWMTAPLKAAAAERDDAELLALWSGQGAALLTDRRDATELFEFLVEDTDHILGATPRPTTAWESVA